MEIFPGLQFDPSQACVGEAEGGKPDGIHKIAESEEAELWGEISGGRLIDYRAFSPDGEELATISWVPGDDEADRPSPAEGLLRPRQSRSGGDLSAEDRKKARPGGTIRPADGYVCAALSGGRYVCWKM